MNEEHLKKLQEGRRNSSVSPEFNPIKKLLSRPTPGQAIKAMCAHCMGCTAEEIDPGFKTEIKNCTSVKCPLHNFRPYRSK